MPRALPASHATSVWHWLVCACQCASHCLSAGWKQQTAHRANPHQGGFSTSLMHLSASAPGEALWLDFGDWAAPHRLQALTLRFAKPDSRRAHWCWGCRSIMPLRRWSA
jgi:hypothetical protein